MAGHVEIRLADLPQVQAFLASVNALLTELVAFAVALIFQLASVDKSVLLNPGAFALIGWLCLAVHLAWPYTPWHRPPP